MKKVTHRRPERKMKQIDSWYCAISPECARKFNRFGRTLAKMGLFTHIWMEVHEEERQEVYWEEGGFADVHEWTEYEVYCNVMMNDKEYYEYELV